MNKKLKNLAARLEEETGYAVTLEGTEFTIGFDDGVIKFDGSMFNSMPEDEAFSMLSHIVDEVTENIKNEEMEGKSPEDLTMAMVVETLPKQIFQDKFLDLTVGYFMMVHGMPSPFRGDTPDMLKKDIRVSAKRNATNRVYGEYMDDIDDELSIFPETEKITVSGKMAENILLANEVLSYIADRMGSNLYMQYTKPGEIRIRPSNRVDIVYLTKEQREFDKNFRNPRSVYMYDREKDEVRIAAYRTIL